MPTRLLPSRFTRLTRGLTRAFLAPGLVLLLMACGGGNGAGDATTPTASDAPSASGGGAAGGGLPAGCSLPPFDLAVRASGDGPRESVRIEDSAAIRGFDGGAWTILMATVPFPAGADFRLGFPEMPADALVLQGGIFVPSGQAGEPQAEIQAGAVFETGDGQSRLPVFGVVQGMEAASTTGRMIRAEVLQASRETVCIAFEVTSESGQEFVGAAAANVVRDE